MANIFLISRAVTSQRPSSSPMKLAIALLATASVPGFGSSFGLHQRRTVFSTRVFSSADAVTGAKFEETDAKKNPEKRPGHAVQGMPEVDEATKQKQEVRRRDASINLNLSNERWDPKPLKKTNSSLRNPSPF